MRPLPSDGDDLARLARSGPLLVEMAGTPGAGKTTGLSELHASLRRRGWATFDPEEGARAMASRTVIGHLVGALPGERLRGALWWRVYLLHRLLGTGRAVLRRPGHFLWLAGRQRGRPEGARARRRRVLHWYLRMAGAQEFYRRQAGAGEAVVFDEGHVHRVVQLFSSPVDAGSAAEVGRYLEGAPRPDLLVHVVCPVDVCVERIRSRGVWARLGDLDRDALVRFVENADRTLGRALDHARARGWQVVEVHNHGDPGGYAARMNVAVSRALEEAGERAPSPGGGLAVPRPGQLAVLARGSLRPPVIPPQVVDSFLSDLGAVRTGPIANLALGRRSDSVRVETGEGRLVVRAYRPHWPDSSLRHEHSLLIQLEKAGYPSARLIPAPGGDTVVQCEGRRMAAYRFAPGRNLSGSFLSAGLRRDVHHLAGRLLAHLHRVTAELDPVGPHHLAGVGTGTDRSAGLAGRLEELASTPLPEGAGLLGRRAGEISDRLCRLHSLLAEQGPRVAVIHGDFGLHNLLLGEDGTATVVDFELARRDWCLIDVVEALGSMSPRDREAFLGGYALEAGGEPDEWGLLDEAWEYHRLAGSVRAWESYVKRGTPERLEVALRRLGEADRVGREGTGAVG